jgi:hypothetical protein
MPNHMFNKIPFWEESGIGGDLWITSIILSNLRISILEAINEHDAVFLFPHPLPPPETAHYFTERR